jgi:hypothetical protein
MSRPSSYPMDLPDLMALAEELGQFGYEDTDDPIYADDRNFYKVEKWSKDGQRIEDMLHASNSIQKAREIFRAFVKKRPRVRLTIRQGIRVLERWPKG